MSVKRRAKLGCHVTRVFHEYGAVRIMLLPTLVILAVISIPKDPLPT